MTEEEKQATVRAVLDTIRAESSDIAELETVESLDNITSLPAQQGEKLVQAPLHLLAKPATDAAATANKAAQQADIATKHADDAAALATENASAAEQAAQAASDAAAKAEDAAEEAATYNDRLKKAENGATARFGGFIEIDGADIDNGDIDIMASEEEFPADAIKYNTRFGRFLVQDSAKVYFDIWKDSGMYNLTKDTGERQACRDKVYLYGTDTYVWDEAAGNLVRSGDGLRHVVRTEKQYSDLKVKDKNTLYLIIESKEEKK